ncbi:hypothetical protein SAMN05216503_1485 [Polaribacter sp. KT25b]|uniref:hypothetical protein n=1 Tax=Polaribacter sp. KT25b TaxID=1855336 RepID=UPI000879BE17|nr:hypothetical protein [Polaribacter sp. KT25b]SDR94843.1 hypothetical protein SAMN05216503_1485 [Polaribacter sp. KT25b]
MKKLTLLIITIIFFNCKTENQSQVDYADSLSNYLTKNEIKLLNRGCELFEKEILKINEKNNVGNSYKEYVESFKEYPRKISESKNINKYLIVLKKSELYNKIWTENKLNENFLDCLIEKSQKPKVKELLNGYKEIIDIALIVVSESLNKSLTEKEYDSKTMKIFIGIEFYYGLKINQIE